MAGPKTQNDGSPLQPDTMTWAHSQIAANHQNHDASHHQQPDASTPPPAPPTIPATRG